MYYETVIQYFLTGTGKKMISDPRCFADIGKVVSPVSAIYIIWKLWIMNSIFKALTFSVVATIFTSLKPKIRVCVLLQDLFKAGECNSVCSSEGRFCV